MLRKRKLRYAKDTGVTEKEPWMDSPDNPLSGAFVPLTERSEPGKARWWARTAQKLGRSVSHGQYDPVPVKPARRLVQE